MISSLPTPPARARPRLLEPQDAPYRPTAGAEVVTADGRSLPLVAARLHGSARGGIARLVLEQRFENPHAEALHVTYRMPLPADGAVSGYAFVLGDRTVVGRALRKHEARARFERAIADGHTAALLEQERADIFTQAIGNLPGGLALIARITIDQRLVWLPEGEWELRFPTVIGPRYVAAGDRADLRATRVVTAPGGVAARIQLAIAIGDELAAGRQPSSPSHALTAGLDGVVELGDLDGARLDRDLVLRWPVAGPTTGVSLAVARPAEGDGCYGLVTIVPPAPAAQGRVLPRDLIVLIDTSGSMYGPPLDKARQVIALLIESLGDADRLELIAFASEPRRYRPEPVAATRAEKQAAIRWLGRLSAGGGTEMRSAVIEALRVLRPDAQRQVVLVTDGYIAGETEIVQQLRRGLPASSRLHFVGVGAAVNRSLATALARVGRGAEVICDLEGDPERAVRRLIDRTRAPVLTDLRLEGSAVLARAPEHMPDVYAASPVVAAIRLRAGELVVRGRTHAGSWEHRLRVTVPAYGDGDPAIAMLYGRERIADLEAHRFAGEDRDAEIEDIGLAFQIATRLTPFVAVDQRTWESSGVRHEEVPQELPYGTTAAAFGVRGADRPPPWFLGTETLLEAAMDPAEAHAFDVTFGAEGDPTVLDGPGFEEPEDRPAPPPPAPASTLLRGSAPFGLSSEVDRGGTRPSGGETPVRSTAEVDPAYRYAAMRIAARFDDRTDALPPAADAPPVGTAPAATTPPSSEPGGHSSKEDSSPPVRIAIMKPASRDVSARPTAGPPASELGGRTRLGVEPARGVGSIARNDPRDDRAPAAPRDIVQGDTSRVIVAASAPPPRPISPAPSGEAPPPASVVISRVTDVPTQRLRRPEIEKRSRRRSRAAMVLLLILAIVSALWWLVL